MHNEKLIIIDNGHYDFEYIQEILLNGGVVELSINYKSRRAFKLHADRIRLIMYKIKKKEFGLYLNIFL